MNHYQGAFVESAFHIVFSKFRLIGRLECPKENPVNSFIEVSSNKNYFIYVKQGITHRI